MSAKAPTMCAKGERMSAKAPTLCAKAAHMSAMAPTISAKFAHMSAKAPTMSAKVAHMSVSAKALVFLGPLRREKCACPEEFRNHFREDLLFFRIPSLLPRRDRPCTSRE